MSVLWPVLWRTEVPPHDHVPQILLQLLELLFLWSRIDGIISQVWELLELLVKTVEDSNHGGDIGVGSHRVPRVVFLHSVDRMLGD